jgi:bifunctional UDP-N-acetylglucosamine pyrophosphorylase / glucosamine-1-phosphate N-acetyltransferase
MRSTLPKVLHEIGGRPLLGHVIAAAQELAPQHVVVVVGHARDRIVPFVSSVAPDASTVVQHEQRGTGHAVRLALEAVTAPGGGPLEGTVVVVAGDVPLLAPETLRGLLAAHDTGDDGRPNAATILSARLADPTGYGRIVRDASGEVSAVVEHRDASPAQLTVNEINSGTYVFDAAALRDALARIETDNAAGEEYLTDVVALLHADGRPVGAVLAIDAAETLGVNDQAQLADVRSLLRDRVVRAHLRAGVVIVDPATTWVDVDVVLEPGATVLPNTQLHGRTHVAAGALIGPNSTLTDTTVEAGASVSNATCVDARIGAEATVGPYTYLRPGTVLGRDAKAGGFVEMKNAVLGEGSKVPHLSYVGDAEIGEGTNIGAATVFVNYDGQDKHRTKVGDHVRVGSDSMLVAPLEIGDGAYTAAGSVITEDVPPGAMAVGRARQRSVEGWVQRKRPGSASARAAEAALDARESMGE